MVSNKTLAAIASPMLTYLIPILIASQGGYLIAGKRGRIIATIAVMGAIVSGITVDPVTGETTVTTMLMASMLVGPAAGWLIKKFDQLIEGHTPAGFEMLIDNFSLGIGGLVLAIVAYLVIGPLMLGILAVLQAGVQVLMQYSLMPLLAIFIEPAKVLFLNNAINHGIFTPIGLEQVANTGRSLMFLLEANPGPGLGVLLAYCFFCKDETTRQSAPGAVIIHFLGGIHEIYFPYVLMNPTVIIAPHRWQRRCDTLVLPRGRRLGCPCVSWLRHRHPQHDAPGLYHHDSRRYRACGGCLLCHRVSHRRPCRDQEPR